MSLHNLSLTSHIIVISDVETKVFHTIAEEELAFLTENALHSLWDGKKQNPDFWNHCSVHVSQA